MGQPPRVIPGTPASAGEGTGGTETSHVPRGTERIPVVAASEPGGAQTLSAHEAAAAADGGLNETRGGPGRGLVGRHTRRRTPLERVTGGGESPVAGRAVPPMSRDREYCRTREIRWEAGSPTTQG
jgi:hypothetical protein